MILVPEGFDPEGVLVPCCFVIASIDALNISIIFSICALFCAVTVLTISAMAKALSSASSSAVFASPDLMLLPCACLAWCAWQILFECTLGTLTMTFVRRVLLPRARVHCRILLIVETSITLLPVSIRVVLECLLSLTASRSYLVVQTE